MGLFLVSVSHLSTRKILIIASLMIIQPIEWIRVICCLYDVPFLEYGEHWMKYGLGQTCDAIRKFFRSCTV